ncbi:MAG TPA: hypothetical protein PLP56_02435 [Candidatus Omnitrophota bacterium]|nr:hypothetical protein [Candidatus Omnitrophota bacterium]HQQ05823.1 hypothetical protein [Candidatus Omnitrophota bacterium]
MHKTIVPLASGALLILVGVTGYSLYRFTVFLQERARMQAELAHVQDEIAYLEQVRDNLSGDLERAREGAQNLMLENSGLKNRIKEDQIKFSMLEAAIVEAQDNAEALSEQISIARQENAALVDQIDSLRAGLSAASQDRDRMAAALSSIDGLKKAIKDLRRKTRSARRSSPVMVRTDAKRRVNEILLGNKGYIIRDGKITMPARVKIEVQASPVDN